MKILRPLLCLAVASAAWACAVTSLPSLLLLVLLPASLVAPSLAAAAVARPERRELLIRRGRYALGVLLLLTLTAFASSGRDSMHLLWNVRYPAMGLWLGAGLLLVSVWEEGEPAVQRRWNGAAAALAGLLVLGGVAFLLPGSGGALSSPLARLEALAAVIRYGFGGSVPGFMLPVSEDQLARGLGHPPRGVTVALGTSLCIALTWTAFVGLALVGRLIPEGSRRTTFWLLSPLATAPLGVAAVLSGRWESLWRNEPWLVQAYGPLLLASGLAGCLLLVLLRLERGRGLASGALPEGEVAAAGGR